jgi:hypothetical protein
MKQEMQITRKMTGKRRNAVAAEVSQSGSIIKSTLGIKSDFHYLISNFQQKYILKIRKRMSNQNFDILSPNNE